MIVVKYSPSGKAYGDDRSFHVVQGWIKKHLERPHIEFMYCTSTSIVIRRLQLEIAKKAISHTNVVISKGGKNYHLAENGQPLQSIPGLFNHAYKVTKELLELW